MRVIWSTLCAALLAGCATSQYSAQEAARQSDEELCRQVWLWRNYQGTIYSGMLGRFPDASFYTLVNRHEEWRTKGASQLDRLPMIGATTGEVRCLWGAPRYSSSAYFEGGSAQSWVYGGTYNTLFGYSVSTALYFKDGKVAGYGSY